MSRHVSAAYPIPASSAVTAVMKANKKVDSGPEVALRSRLHRYGLRFRKNKRVMVAGATVRPDIVFSKERVAVFVDGCFWHSCPLHGNLPKRNEAYWHPKLARTVKRDREVSQRLRQGGWIVIRVWEHELMDDVAQAIFSAVMTRRLTLRVVQ